MARRFWCDAVLCRRRIFCEQFDNGVLSRYGRRTQRLETIVHHLGLALGGRPAAVFADQSDELSVIGIDDFAFRSGQTYGTIVCDLEVNIPELVIA